MVSVIVLAVLLGGGSGVLAQQHVNNNLRGSGSEFNFPTNVKLRTKPNTPYRMFTSNTAKNRAKQSRHHISDDDVHADDIPAHNSTPPLEQNTISTTSEQLLTQCPSKYNPQRTNYIQGDIVQVYNTIFTCQDVDYCNISTLDEAKQLLSKDKHNGGGDTNVDDSDRFGSSSKVGEGEISMSDEEKIEQLWLHAWVEGSKCVPQSTSTLSPISLSPTSAAPTTKSPTTKHPTYWPTYSPSTVDPTNAPSFHPTDAPSHSPTSSPLAISLDAFDNNLSKDNSQNISCSPTQTHMRIEIQTDNYPTDTKWKLIDQTSKIILLSSPTRGYKGKKLDNDGRMEAQTDIREICLGNFDDQQQSIQPRRGSPSSLQTQHDDRVIKTMKRNRYEFVLYDKYGDGLCCRPDNVQGFYKVMQRKKREDIIIGDEEENKWQVLVAGSNFKQNEVHHHFKLEMKSSTLPILEQTSLIDDEDKEDRDINLASTSTSSAALELLCPSPQRKITIQVQTDVYGEDTTWTFKSKDTGMLLAKNERNYTNNEVHIDQRDVCIDDSSLYEFTVTDIYADGLKTAQFNDKIPQGHYKIWTHHGMSNDVEIDREVILHGGYFKAYEITHLINTTLPTLSDRDEVWLYEHNKRRKYWHAYYNTSYIPLQWSESLKAEAQESQRLFCFYLMNSCVQYEMLVWADHLLDYCKPGVKDGIYHDPDRIYGENAAANEGGGGWGSRREPEKILARFVEYEVEWPWPDNGHLTQTLWRASKYVGCAEGHRVNSQKHQCHTQVCRYARTGNCNMGSFKREDGTMDYVTAMLEDDNYCGPICPGGGCHA